MKQTKQELMLWSFNKKVAGRWDLLSWLYGVDITLSVSNYYYEPFKRSDDGKRFVSAYYYIPEIEEITDKTLETHWISVRGKVEMVDEMFLDHPYNYEEFERIILPAEFDFSWDEKREEWKLESWDFVKKEDREKYEPTI